MLFTEMSGGAQGPFQHAFLRRADAIRAPCPGRSWRLSLHIWGISTKEGEKEKMKEVRKKEREGGREEEGRKKKGKVKIAFYFGEASNPGPGLESIVCLQEFFFF